MKIIYSDGVRPLSMRLEAILACSSARPRLRPGEAFVFDAKDGFRVATPEEYDLLRFRILPPKMVRFLIQRSSL